MALSNLEMPEDEGGRGQARGPAVCRQGAWMWAHHEKCPASRGISFQLFYLSLQRTRCKRRRALGHSVLT